MEDKIEVIKLENKKYKNVVYNDFKIREKDLEIFKETSKWLDIYFSGKNPNFTLKYKIKNLTPFRQEVTDIMNSIEYGEVVTYKDISKIIAEKRGIKIMSSQAVGGAVGLPRGECARRGE